MKWLLFFSMILCVVCCDEGGRRQSVVSNVPHALYERDKRQIEDCFMKNVEYYRLHHYDESYKKAQEDPLYYYLPYAQAMIPGSVNGIMCPLNVKKYLKVTVDTIIYDKRGLKCFAFLGIYRKTIDKGWYKTCTKGKNYDARAVIGIRDRMGDSLTIVPNASFVVLLYDTYRKAVDLLEYLYCNKLKESWLSILYHGGKAEYIHNVGDEGFFEESPFFKKNDDNVYEFQSRCYENGECMYPFDK